MLKDSGSTTITYDMKLSVKGKGKVDIHLRFTDGKPEVVATGYIIRRMKGKY